MQSALDAGAVIRVEIADALDDEFKIVVRDLAIGESHFAVKVTRRWHAPQIEDDFEQFVGSVGLGQGCADGGRQHFDQVVDVVSDSFLHFRFIRG